MKDYLDLEMVTKQAQSKIILLLMVTLTPTHETVRFELKTRHV